jgi:hypothetical protein
MGATGAIADEIEIELVVKRRVDGVRCAEETHRITGASEAETNRAMFNLSADSIGLTRTNPKILCGQKKPGRARSVEPLSAGRD